MFFVRWFRYMTDLGFLLINFLNHFAVFVLVYGGFDVLEWIRVAVYGNRVSVSLFLR